MVSAEGCPAGWCVVSGTNETKEKTVTMWIAEDLPAHLFGGPRPASGWGADAAASEPVRLIGGATQDRARHALMLHLYETANLPTVYEAGDDIWFKAAAEEIRQGGSVVRVRQRVYRLRDTAVCGVMAYHGACPVCAPAGFPSFTRGGC